MNTPAFPRAPRIGARCSHCALARVQALRTFAHANVRVHLFSISRLPGVEVEEGYTIRRHRRSGYKHFWPTATPSLSEPALPGAETHEAGLAAGTRALTVMATGRHAAGSDFGASAPTAAALKSHPTVPVALPAPLCSCPPTPLSAMPVVTFTLTPQPGEPGERQPGAEPGGQSPKLRSAGTPVNGQQADRPRCWIEALGSRWAAQRAPH